jgi:hypothetical protein
VSREQIGEWPVDGCRLGRRLGEAGKPQRPGMRRECRQHHVVALTESIEIEQLRVTRQSPGSGLRQPRHGCEIGAALLQQAVDQRL